MIAIDLRLIFSAQLLKNLESWRHLGNLSNLEKHMRFLSGDYRAVQKTVTIDVPINKYYNKFTLTSKD